MEYTSHTPPNIQIFVCVYLRVNLLHLPQQLQMIIAVFYYSATFSVIYKAISSYNTEKDQAKQEYQKQQPRQLS